MPQFTSLFPDIETPLLIGRDDELASAITTMRDPSTRLLTVTGPAGVGKTRFAIELARLLASDYSGGTLVIDLATIRDPTELCGELGRRWGIRDRDSDILARLIDEWLADREVLLVLDNAEHVLGIGPRVAELLTASPRSRVLITSRHRLHLSRELELELEPLAVSDGANRRAALSTTTMSPAGKLFLQMMGDKADADPDHEVLELVERISARLEGLPLALELVAARVPALTAAELSRVLDEGDAPPGTGSPSVETALTRSFDASYRLLSAAAQQVLRYLTVFTGGFSTELVERQLAHAERIDLAGASVYDCLLELSEHHLILPVDDARTGTPRYRLMMMVAETAHRKLVHHGEVSDAHRALARGVIDFAEHRQGSGIRPRHEYHIVELEEEYHNIIAALSWLDDQDDLPSLLRLVGSLAWFWYAHGHFRVGQEWFERVLAHDNAPREGLHWARLMTGYGMILDVQGHFAEAGPLLEEAYAAFEAIDLHFGMSYTGLVRGLCSFHQERYDDAERALYRAIEDARRVEDPDLAQTVEGLAWENLGANAHEQGRLDEASVALQSGIAILRKVGLRWGIARTLCDIGCLERDRGDLQAALVSHQSALEPARQLGDNRLIAASLAGLATVLAQDGQPLLVAWFWGAVDALRPVAGNPSFLKVNIRAYDRGRKRARRALGNAQYAGTYAIGAQAPLDEVLELAAGVKLTWEGSQAIPSDITRRLTDRENDVLRQLLLGASTRVIATTLGIKERTVSTHIGSLFRKLGVGSRLELIALINQTR